MNQRPLFSIIHPSARPHAWRAAYEKWISRAARPETVEYILGADERWGFSRRASDDNPTFAWGHEDRFASELDKLTYNAGRKCIVDNANTAAAASSGQILVVIADDIEPPHTWDISIRQALEASGKWTCDDVVIEVSTGTPSDARHLMLLPFFTRARYERVGYAMYPEYESMRADDDFGEHARADAELGQTTIVNATHLVFPHHHPAFDPSVPVDPVYEHQNRKQAYALGASILARRRAAHFQETYPYEPKPGASGTAVTGDPWEALRQIRDVCALSASSVTAAHETLAIIDRVLSSHPGSVSKPFTIACCLPGESFRWEWVTGWDTLLIHLLQERKLFVHRIPGSAENAFHMRIKMAETALQDLDPKPDLLLWIDDDNVLTPEQFDMLLADLDANPTVDGVVGWTWINEHDGTWRVSCGDLQKDRAAGMPIPAREMVELIQQGGVRPITWSGFPCVLMRTRAIEKAGGPRAFRPWISDLSTYETDDDSSGFSGEDYSFFRRATDRRCVFLVDSRVYVPHLKVRVDEPTFGALDPKPQQGEWKAPNGKRFERTGEVRVVEDGEWHWCGATVEQMLPGGVSHECEIWREVESLTTGEGRGVPADSPLPREHCPECNALAGLSHSPRCVFNEQESVGAD